MWGGVSGGVGDLYIDELHIRKCAGGAKGGQILYMTRKHLSYNG